MHKDAEFVAKLISELIMRNETELMRDAIGEYEFMRDNNAIGMHETRAEIIAESLIEAFLHTNELQFPDNDAMITMRTRARDYFEDIAEFIISYFNIE